MVEPSPLTSPRRRGLSVEPKAYTTRAKGIGMMIEKFPKMQTAKAPQYPYTVTSSIIQAQMSKTRNPILKGSKPY